MPDIPAVRQVVAAVIERNAKILIAQRARSASHPLKWEFPGGKIEPGETPEQALARELREELGIHALIGTLIGTHQVQYANTPPTRLLFYRVTEFQGEPRNLQFERIAWEAPANLPDYDFLEGDVGFVARLAASAEPERS